MNQPWHGVPPSGGNALHRLKPGLHTRTLSLHGRHLLDRRRFLSSTAAALGSIALTNLLGVDGLLAAPAPLLDPARPYAPRRPHFPAKARNVIVIFCAGAVSQ